MRRGCGGGGGPVRATYHVVCRRATRGHSVCAACAARPTTLTPPNVSDPNAPVWLITGCSTGFGRELARAVLDRGERAVVTARDPSTIQDLVADRGDAAIALRLDVTKPDEIAAAVRTAEATFGRIDVLVNNAGIGYFGAIEESDEAEVRRMFEINVFGLAAMTRAVLPGMRARRSGHVVNVAS